MIATSRFAFSSVRPSKSSLSSRRGRRNATTTTTTKAVKIAFVDPDGKIIETNQTKGILRTIALDSGVEIYEGFSKLMNCGGNGQCGTCSMIVSDPSECLSGTTDAERKKLGKEKLGKGYRLCCQTEIVAGEENENENATIECKTKPPKK
jgi:ferredoxin